MKQIVNKNLFSQIVKYAKKNLLEGYLSNKGRLSLRTIHDNKRINIPLSCFTRTRGGDIVLYRGINRVLDNTEDYSKSVAAAVFGESKKDILKEYQKSVESLASIFSTQNLAKDPILHTTTQRNFAESLADNGALIEYHIPEKYLSEYGIVGHLAENEIDFFHSIPNKFIASITKMPKNISNGLPETIDLSNLFR